MLIEPIREVLVYVQQKASIARVTRGFGIDLDTQCSKRVVPNAPSPVRRFVVVEPKAVGKNISSVRSCIIREQEYFGNFLGTWIRLATRGT